MNVLPKDLNCLSRLKKWQTPFTELNDALDQRSRFEDQVKAKELGDEEASELMISLSLNGMPAGIGSE